jgi:hypothetical protein
MRDKWYGDNRDILKWSALLYIADRFNIRSIAQICYYRESEWPEILIDGTAHVIPEPVRNHFRNVKAARTIRCNIPLFVFDNVLDSRTTYMNEALKFIDSIHLRPTIIFVDPDTGLQPEKSKPSLEHVLETDLNRIWHTLKSGEVLSVYQHETNKAGKPWIEQKKAQFARSIGIDDQHIGIASSMKLARDVIMMYARK